jgi:hypothetical protein
MKLKLIKLNPGMGWEFLNFLNPTLDWAEITRSTEFSSIRQYGLRFEVIHFHPWSIKVLMEAHFENSLSLFGTYANSEFSFCWKGFRIKFDFVLLYKLEHRFSAHRNAFQVKVWLFGTKIKHVLKFGHKNKKYTIIKVSFQKYFNEPGWSIYVSTPLWLWLFLSFS